MTGGRDDGVDKGEDEVGGWKGDGGGGGGARSRGGRMWGHQEAVMMGGVGGECFWVLLGNEGDEQYELGILGYFERFLV